MRAGAFESAWLTAWSTAWPTAWLTTLMILLAPGALAVEEGLTLTPETIVDLRTVRSVALHPGGQIVAYTLSVPRDEKDDPGSGYVQLWLSDAAEQPRQFTSGKERLSSLDWSPDGKLISFLLKREQVHEQSQIFVIPRDGGEAKALTDHDASISSYRWSPNGDAVAFIAPPAETEERKEAKKSGKDWKVDGDLTPRLLWRFDVERGESVQLLEGLNPWSLEWAPDGRQLVIQASTGMSVDDSMMFRRIYAVPASGEGEPRRITETEGKLGTMGVSPDGKTVAFLGAVSMNDPIAQSLFVVPFSGGPARNLTEGYAGSASDMVWLDDRTLLMVSVEGERDKLYRVDVASGARTAVEWSDRIVRDLSVRPASGRAAYALNGSDHPTDLYVGDIGDVPTRRANHQPELEGIRLARQETVRWTAPDGWTIGGVLTYPLDYVAGMRYPLVLQIHGGPEGVSLDGWTTGALYPVQLLAKAGYVVLEPNYRGSMGRGVAFSKADHDDLGGKEFDDVLAGIDALVERGLVDRDRVGTGGWSYGGYLSAWAATRHSDRFKASMVGAGLTNWIAFAGTTDIPHEMALVHWNSYWYDRPELHWERSPLAHLDRAKTPTLIVHGEKDDRVHPEQGIELYTGLRLKNVPTSLVLYPREPHGLNERAHQLDFIERTIGWFNENLQPETGAEREASR